MICLTKNIFLLFAVFFLTIKSSYLYAQTSIVQDTISLELKSKENIDTNFFNVFPKSYSQKKIALVLSGGGARGICQLGVIKELEKYGISPDMIVGTSIGAIIGGFYSSGYSTNEIEKILKKFNWTRALSLTNKYQRTSLFLEQKKIQDRSLLTIPLDGIKPVLLPSSFSNGQYLSAEINSYIVNAPFHPKKNFSDLKIPFAAVATNMDNGEKVILTEGNLSESIKASLTFPLLYTPIIINGKNLIDGGLTANIPAEVAKKLGADFTIVVNSTSPLKSEEEIDDPLTAADQILSITMAQLNQLQLKESNILITPDIGKYSSNDFSKIDYLIDKGKQQTSECISDILYSLDSLETSGSKYFNNFITNPAVKVNSEYSKVEFEDSLSRITDKRFEKYISIEKNLKGIYKSGFFRNVYAVISRDESSALISYELISNPELKSLEYKNNPATVDSLLNDFTEKHKNKIINLNECREFYNNLLSELRRKSYPLIEITKFHFDYDSGKLTIEFTDGEMGDLKLRGNKTTNDNVILREIKIDPELPVRKKEVKESINNVMSTNLFQQVSFNFNYADNSVKPSLIVNVIEKNSKALRFSMKADNERKLQLLIDIRDENLFGTGIEGGLLAAGGLSNRIYQLEIKSNQFFSLPLTFNFAGYYTFKDISRYLQIVDTVENEFNVVKVGEYRNLRNGGLSFLFGTQLERLGTAYAQTFFENQEIINKFDSENLTEKLRVIKLKFGGIFDTQDVLPFPTKGYLINFYYETAKDVLSPNLSFSKLYFGYEQYFSIASKQILRPRFVFGFADNTTPLTEQYSLGGEKSFFGMVEDELRGRQILAYSLEYRILFPYKLFFDTYFSARYDVGNVWKVTEDIRFKDLRHGLGLTAGFDTPVGEASFSVGRSFLISKGLTEDSFIFGPYDFYFSIGYEL